jgi:uncharacterized protein YndB with AHSA1/START domain
MGAAPDVPAVIVAHALPASAARVFDAWTSPDDLRRWWRMTPAHAVPVAEVDCRPGGAYRLGMTGPSGTTYVVEGRFRAVEPPRRLVYTWRWTAPQTSPESVVTVTLADGAGGVEARVVHAGLAAEPERRAHRALWDGCLASLETLLRDA